MGVELEMNRNTAELYGWPLEGGGGTVYPESICTMRNACANGVSAFAHSTAQHSTAQHSTAQL